MSTLVKAQRFYFSKDLFLSGSNPIRERVMSTPTWPVPYYQRLTKAYPIRGSPPSTQNRPSPPSAASISPPTIPRGCPPSTCSTRLPRDVRLSLTPSSTSRLTVLPSPRSLSHQEGRLRDHGQGLRQRHLPIPRRHQQGERQDPQGTHPYLIANNAYPPTLIHPFPARPALPLSLSPRVEYNINWRCCSGD